MKTISLIILTFFSVQGFCCECISIEKNDSSSVTNAFESSDLVIIGDVIELINEKGFDGNGYIVARVKVHENHKGTFKNKIVRVKGIDESTCSFFFKTGTRYLIYSYAVRNEGFQTDICTRTRVFTDSLYDNLILEKY